MMYEVIRTKDSSGAYYISPPTISRHATLRAAVQAMRRAGAKEHRIIMHAPNGDYYLDYITDGKATFIGKRGDAKEVPLR